MPRKCANQLWFRHFIFLLATMTASRSWLGRGQYSLVPRVRETPNVARQEQKLEEARLLKMPEPWTCISHSSTPSEQGPFCCLSENRAPSASPLTCPRLPRL